jgi:hypothetical protein
MPKNLAARTDRALAKPQTTRAVSSIIIGKEEQLWLFMKHPKEPLKAKTNQKFAGGVLIV